MHPLITESVWARKRKEKNKKEPKIHFSHLPRPTFTQNTFFFTPKTAEIDVPHINRVLVPWKTRRKQRAAKKKEKKGKMMVIIFGQPIKIILRTPIS